MACSYSVCFFYDIFANGKSRLGWLVYSNDFWLKLYNFICKNYPLSQRLSQIVNTISFAFRDTQTYFSCIMSYLCCIMEIYCRRINTNTLHQRNKYNSILFMLTVVPVQSKLILQVHHNYVTFILESSRYRPYI